MCDRIASDALKGIASVEEVQDELAPANGNGVRTVTPRRKTAKPEAVAALEPPLEPDATRDTTAQPEPSTDTQEPLLDDEWPDGPEVPK